MTFFLKVIKVMKVIGFLIILIGISYVITSVTYYSYNNEERKVYPIDVFDYEGIQVINIENKEDIIIEVTINKNVNNEKLIAYSFYYLDIYNKEVHLYVINQNTIVVTGKNMISSIKSQMK